MPADVTRNDLNPVSIPLRDFSLAALQDIDDFVLGKGPFKEVEERSGLYFTYDTGAWNRDEMTPRGPGRSRPAADGRSQTTPFSQTSMVCTSTITGTTSATATT